MFTSYLRPLFAILFLTGSLTACGNKDEKTAQEEKTQDIAPAGASVEAQKNEAIEDNGVVYEEEIYNNWPVHK